MMVNFCFLLEIVVNNWAGDLWTLTFKEFSLSSSSSTTFPLNFLLNAYMCPPIKPCALFFLAKILFIHLNPFTAILPFHRFFFRNVAFRLWSFGLTYPFSIPLPERLSFSYQLIRFKSKNKKGDCLFFFNRNIG